MSLLVVWVYDSGIPCYLAGAALGFSLSLPLDPCYYSLEKWSPHFGMYLSTPPHPFMVRDGEGIWDEIFILLLSFSLSLSFAVFLVSFSHIRKQEAGSRSIARFWGVWKWGECMIEEEDVGVSWEMDGPGFQEGKKIEIEMSTEKRDLHLDIRSVSVEVQTIIPKVCKTHSWSLTRGSILERRRHETFVHTRKSSSSITTSSLHLQKNHLHHNRKC